MLLSDSMERKPDKKCLAAALRLLTSRDHGCTELKRKLKQRGFAGQDVKLTINECIRLSYLDDERFSLNFLRQLVRKGYGPKQVQQRLRTKGIANVIIMDVLDRNFPESIQIETCRITAHKKLSSASFATRSEKLKARLYRFLYGRGFNSEVIRQVLDEIA